MKPTDFFREPHFGFRNQQFSFTCFYLIKGVQKAGPATARRDAKKSVGYRRARSTLGSGQETQTITRKIAKEKQGKNTAHQKHWTSTCPPTEQEIEIQTFYSRGLSDTQQPTLGPGCLRMHLAPRLRTLLLKLKRTGSKK